MASKAVAIHRKNVLIGLLAVRGVQAHCLVNEYISVRRRVKHKKKISPLVYTKVNRALMEGARSICWDVAGDYSPGRHLALNSAR